MPPTVTLSRSCGTDGELVGKVLLVDDCLHGTVGELSADGNRLEDEPSLHEACGGGRPAGVGYVSGAAGPRGSQPAAMATAKTAEPVRMVSAGVLLLRNMS